MKNKIIYMLLIISLCVVGCATDQQQAQKSSPAGVSARPNLGGLVFEPVDVDPSALPSMSDLPVPAKVRMAKDVRSYTGIIKNKTRYDLSVPSANSGATLPLPASGWIEYTAWSKHIDVTAYHEGKPFYCLKIHANPKNYAFMCKKYDFVAEIVKAEPVRKAKPVRKKRPVRKKPKGAEVEGLGFMGQRSQPLL